MTDHFKTLYKLALKAKEAIKEVEDDCGIKWAIEFSSLIDCNILCGNVTNGRRKIMHYWCEVGSFIVDGCADLANQFLEVRNPSIMILPVIDQRYENKVTMNHFIKNNLVKS